MEKDIFTLGKTKIVLASLNDGLTLIMSKKTYNLLNENKNKIANKLIYFLGDEKVSICKYSLDLKTFEYGHLYGSGCFQIMVI